MWQIALLVGGVSLAFADANSTSSPETVPMFRVYVGTYTGGKSQSKGIALLDFNTGTGALTMKGYAAEAASPSFLAIHPSRKFVYSVNEVAGGKSGGVSAFAVVPETGMLTPLNQESSQGAGPCHLVVDKLGKNVLVANYGGGSIAVLPIGPDGRLKPATSAIQHSGTVFDPKRQGGPHAHSINLDAANKFAVVADLGLDRLFVYRFDAEKGTLTPNDPPYTEVAKRSGPRHFTFHPDGRHAYVINEINLTVTAFEYDPDRGVLTAIETLPTLPKGTEARGSTAEVQVHPTGKFLYGSNRGHNSIAIFAIDQATGRLTPVGHQSTEGRTPRNFAIDPTGKFLLAENQDSGTIVVFKIDMATGKLTPAGQTAEVPSPVCVKFMSMVK